MATNNKKSFPVTEAILTPEFRASFADNVINPETKNKQDGSGTYEQWGVCALFDKSQDISAIRRLAAEAIELAWPKEEDRPRKFRKAIKDGDSGDHTNDGIPPCEKYEGYAGHVYINLISYKQPGVVHKSNVNKPIMDPKEVYSGSYGIAQIRAQAYVSQAGAGVRLYLNNYMKTRDGDVLAGGGKTNPADAFAALVDSNDGDTETPSSSSSLADMV